MTQNAPAPLDVAVIGAGFAGLAAATTLASRGLNVTIFERHDHAGGRARRFEAEGFRFDMGPSWYWMPDVFDRYFAQFGTTVADLYDLVRLDPSYRVEFEDGPFDVPAGTEALAEAFEAIETGAGQKLRDFLTEAKVKYDIGMGRFVNKPAHNALEFARLDILKDAPRLQLLRSFSDHVRKHFKDPRLVELMEFPVFSWVPSRKTPALYSLMNQWTPLGTWYPMGGMHKIVDGMVDVAKAQGVRFEFSCQVEGILEENGKTAGLQWVGPLFAAPCDCCVRLPPRRAAPASQALPQVRRSLLGRPRNVAEFLLFYLGVDRRIPGLKHHTLFFDTSFDAHAQEIYDAPAWPKTRCSMSVPPGHRPQRGSGRVRKPLPAGADRPGHGRRRGSMRPHLRPNHGPTGGQNRRPHSRACRLQTAVCPPPIHRRLQRLQGQRLWLGQHPAADGILETQAEVQATGMHCRTIDDLGASPSSATSRRQRAPQIPWHGRRAGNRGQRTTCRFAGLSHTAQMNARPPIADPHANSVTPVAPATGAVDVDLLDTALV